MSVDILTGDCRELLQTLPEASVQTCVTSPPYFGLRDYGVNGQIGLERSVDEYVAELAGVFRDVRRVLRDDGTLWLNLGDSYANQKTGDTYSGFNARWSGTGLDGGKQAQTFAAVDQTRRYDFGGLKPKDLIGIPWRVAFALQADGWWLRQDIIWHKPNPMPESVRDRCTKAHEYIFLLSKRERYLYQADAVAEPSVCDESYKPFRPRNADKREGDRFFATKVGNHANGKIYPTRNRRSVWTVTTKPYSGAHFATFPPDLIEPCIRAGSKPGDTVLDPFGGAGTTGLVADRHGRDAILIELNPEYAEMARQRIVTAHGPLLAGVAS